MERAAHSRCVSLAARAQRNCTQLMHRVRADTFSPAARQPPWRLLRLCSADSPALFAGEPGLLSAARQNRVSIIRCNRILPASPCAFSPLRDALN